MPKRQDLKKVMILGSGPIVIGQACEFDYSGTQACKALMKEGFEVILVNSNPATIMTDPEIATRVYIEPLKTNFLEKIIAKEKPDALIPTLGGQTALNAALALDAEGILAKYKVEMLGTSSEIIKKAEDRELFKKLLIEIGAKPARSKLIRNFEEGIEFSQQMDFPLILRPNYTLGGSGGGVAYSLEDYKPLLQGALTESPTSEVLVEQSLLGWKEFELEVMRDKNGTFVVICSIENFDPCGVHTGDSITVAPQQTLTDREYQDMRTEARKIIDAVGVEVGGANIQFAVNPENGDRVVIEMNPRVSRSSALASKATGFPIAKISALLAVGYGLDEIQNDITGSTPCCYEPALDYVVTKIPRFAFEKFHGSKDLLSTQMKAVGEVMGIGRTFKESLQKALNSLEKKEGFAPTVFSDKLLVYPNSNRIYHLAQAFRDGLSVEEVARLTHITPWFLDHIKEIVDMESVLSKADLTAELLRDAKRMGFSDATIARVKNISKSEVFDLRQKWNLHPAFLRVDTCAGEFASDTPYYYSTYWSDPCLAQKKTDTVVVIGSGPNRIGQGIEFDYGCVRGAKAFQRAGIRVAMINSNPETVSTDYDTSNELFFEPLQEEYVLEVMRFLGPMGFASQWGGQTSLKLSVPLVKSGYQILGSSLESIDMAEDRSIFSNVCRELGVLMPKARNASTLEEAKSAAAEIGYPILCRPSYVLGGKRMEIMEIEEELVSYFDRYGRDITPSSPILIDEFLDGALEVDVDLVRSKKWAVVGGIVEHIEAAGIHSGDSMGVLPPQRLREETSRRVEEIALKLAEKMNVIGHLNLQIAIRNDQIYMLEANPRSSRSVPFVAKATLIPLVDLAVDAMLDRDLSHKYEWKNVEKVSVKGVVFPFKKFPEADSLLGPEMKSTGETMGRGDDYSEALMKALISSHVKLPPAGEVFLSLKEKDKERLLPMVKELIGLGFTLSATQGTAQFLNAHDIQCVSTRKVYEGRPNCVDRIRSGMVALVINTAAGRLSIQDSFSIRRSCIDYFIPCITEKDAAQAFLLALKKERRGSVEVSPL